MSEENSRLRRRVWTGGTLAFLAKIGAAITSYLFLLVLARWMHPQEFGYFAIGFSLATLGGSIANFGQPQASMRFFPEHLARKEYGLAHGVYIDGVRLTLIAGVSGGLLFAAGVYGAHLLGFHVALWPLLAAAILIPPFVASTYWASFVQALGKTLLAMMPRDLLWRLVVVAVAGLLWLRGVSLTATGVLFLSASLLTLIVVIQAGVAHFFVPASVRSAPVQYDYAKWWNVWMAMWVAAALTVVLAQIDVSLVGAILKSDQAGLYFVVLSTANLLALVKISANTVMAPMLSYYYHSNDMENLQSVFRTSAPGLLLGTVVGFTALVLFGHTILGFFGPHFPAMYGVLITLSVGYAGGVLCGSGGTMLLMTGHQNIYTLFLATAVVISISVQIVGMMVWGIWGAALGNCTAQLLLNISMWLYIRKTTGIDTSAFANLLRRSS